jgi:hypothetical protein
MSTTEKTPQPVALPTNRTRAILNKFVRDNRRPLSALVFFVVLIAISWSQTPDYF